ncbi:hypothetical protein GPECTOR_38g274 [Gonium pectorale]|uniref:Ankyrin repeat domain-containing protein n=1 Tax=Gonium pectorale TaxID=33097 RepID=A0A150GB12_GONPE|nr:hypothetical protein GPECTOR_38g274 [Gonium pectorale]|eukprot:KXZ47037.1 hypothetical protein GPECTOR_38g274 [Gonium pectorale]
MRPSNVADAARFSGSVELLGWLRERGCPWDATACEGAAEGGCEEALEWLAERGCPMPGDGSPYVAACRNGDLAMLRCLQRLGVAWGPPGAVFHEAMRADANLAVLRWLLEAGCSFDYVAAREALVPRAEKCSGVAELLEQLGQRWGLREGQR